MKRIILLIVLVSAVMLMAQVQVEDYIWIYDAANPPSELEYRDEWTKPIWKFTAQDSLQYYMSPYYESCSGGACLQPCQLKELIPERVIDKNGLQKNCVQRKIQFFSEEK